MKQDVEPKAQRKSLPTPVVVGAAALLAVGVFAGIAWASNMGFKLNIRALNALFQPSGCDASGTWSGQGSGVSFALEWSGNEADVAHLRMRTPAGTISLPYTDPGVRYGGGGYFFNYALEPPLEFVSADGAASISIQSKWEGDPMVRFSGTGFCVETPGGPVKISVTSDRIEVNVDVESEAWNLETDSAGQGRWVREW